MTMDEATLTKAVSKFFDDAAHKEQEELEQLVAVLVPVCGEEDARVAATLHQDIRMAGKRAMAEAGAEFIRSRLASPGPLSPGGPINLLLVSPRKAP